MARTSIVLDDRLIGEVMRVSDARTKREAVDTALRAYVAERPLTAH
jgi:Arc/MetJ family transcription regulator